MLAFFFPFCANGDGSLVFFSRPSVPTEVKLQNIWGPRINTWAHLWSLSPGQVLWTSLLHQICISKQTPRVVTSAATTVLGGLHLTYCVVAPVVKPLQQKLANCFCKIVTEKVTQHPWYIEDLQKAIRSRRGENIYAPPYRDFHLEFVNLKSLSFRACLAIWG